MQEQQQQANQILNALPAPPPSLVRPELGTLFESEKNHFPTIFDHFFAMILSDDKPADVKTNTSPEKANDAGASSAAAGDKTTKKDQEGDTCQVCPCPFFPFVHSLPLCIMQNNHPLMLVRPLIHQSHLMLMQAVLQPVIKLQRKIKKVIHAKFALAHSCESSLSLPLP